MWTGGAEPRTQKKANPKPALRPPLKTAVDGEQAIHNSQWSVRCARRARLRPSLAYWAYFALLRSSIRNSRLATLPLASLPPLSSAWSLRVFAPPCADACAVFRGCALRFAPCARHFSPSGLRCSQAHSRRSLPYWGLRTGLRFAGPVFRGCGALRAVPQFSMVVPLRSQARLRHSLLHWAYFALFRSTIHNGRLAAPNGLQRSLVHWTSASPVSRTARGEAPSHWARASCAPRHCHPQFAMVVPRRAQSALAALPCSLGLLRPVSATGGGLRAPPSSFR